MENKLNIAFVIPDNDWLDLKGDYFEVAEITHEQLAELNKAMLQIVENPILLDGACVKNMRLQQVAKYDISANKKKCDIFHKVEILNLPGRTRWAPCETPEPTTFKRSALGKCAVNFRNGKCTCPFMGGIVGPIILPNLYQKTK